MRPAGNPPCPHGSLSDRASRWRLPCMHTTWVAIVGSKTEEGTTYEELEAALGRLLGNRAEVDVTFVVCLHTPDGPVAKVSQYRHRRSN